MQPRSGRTWVTMVAAGTLLLAAVGCGGDGDDDAPSDGDRNDEGAAPPSGRDRRGEDEAPPPGDVRYQCPDVDTEVDGHSSIEVVEAGACTYSYGPPTLDFIRYALVVENTGAEPMVDVEIRVEADTDEGRIDLLPTPDRIDVLPEGTRIGIGHADGLQELVIVETLVVTIDASPVEDVAELTRGEVFIREAATTLDDDGDRTNTISVSTNASDTLEDLPVYYVYRNDAGDILGGASGTIDALPPPAPIEHRYTDPYANPDVATVEAFVNAPVLPYGAGTDATTDAMCAALNVAGADSLEIRFTMRQGGPAAAELLSRLEGITPAPAIADAWATMVAGDGRRSEGPTDPLEQATNDVSSFVLDNCGVFTLTS